MTGPRAFRLAVVFWLWTCLFIAHPALAVVVACGVFYYRHRKARQMQATLRWLQDGAWRTP